MNQRDKIQELTRQIRPYPVDFLYKYRSMESKGLADIFEKRKIYFTDPTTFNDPFECRPKLTFHQSALKREKYLKLLTKERFPNADKRMIKKLMRDHANRKLLTDLTHLKRMHKLFLSSVGVCCLSERNDDILMWSHYSDAHKGLCIQFDASRNDTLFWEALKVIYSKEYPEINIMALGEGDPHEFRKALLTKSVHWNYEEERRVLKMEEEGGPEYYSFSPDLLTGIIIGAVMPQEYVDIILIMKHPKR